MDALPLADPAVFFLQEAGWLLFGAVFLFLWRQSGAVYFGLWAAAAATQVVAHPLGFELLRSSNPAWLAPYAVFQFGFAIILIAAARVGFAGAAGDWRGVLRLIAILPIFVALVWALGLWFGRLRAYEPAYEVALCCGYAFNYATLRRNAGWGARVFRLALLAAAAATAAEATVGFSALGGSRAGWVSYLRPYDSYAGAVLLALHCLIAFAAMATWSESQIDRVCELGGELDRARRDNARDIDLDHLTGLLNQAALARRMEPGGPLFQGVVAVCDMDNFKDVNDSYGHLVGDEILRNIGHLLTASIRQEDEAFRWGGDEFVILFQDQHSNVAHNRMAEIEARLHDFRVRGYGALPISFSWGTADSSGRGLREALEDADRMMYRMKRTRAAGALQQRPPVA